MTTSSEAAPLKGVRILALFGGAHLFGQERANLEVMRTVTDAGAELRVIVDERYAEGEIEEELARLGFSYIRAKFTVHWHYAVRRVRYFLFNLSALRSTSDALKREAREWGPTHLYLMNWNYFASGFFAFRKLHQPLVFRAGDLLPRHSIFHRWLTRQLLRRAKLIVCNSNFLARDMRGLGASSDKLRVIHNHPPVRGITASAEWFPTSRAVRLLFVGQVARHKGVDILIDAVRDMIAAGQDISLSIAGESTWGDPLQVQLQEEVTRLGLHDRITFLGKRADIPQLFAQADIHACPSLIDDSSPNVILEAKREGVPSVAFPVGGIPELIAHKVDGFLCRDASREALMEGLAYFIQDPRARQAATQAARQTYEASFGFSRFQRDWAKVFRETMP
jgi:glycosyltransferase involved in cell wall biosynthesis